MNFEVGGGARAPLTPPLVCLVTDGRRDATDLIDRVVAAVDGGVRLVQLREPQRPAGELLDLAQRLHDRIGRRAALVINDRLDVALAAGAEGVHLPGRGLPPRQARRLAPHLLVGRSVHSAAEAESAVEQEVDYLVLGTIFATATHPDTEPGGLDLVRETRARVRLPLLAIGGITLDNAAATIAAGADGVAVITALLNAPDPAAAADRLFGAVRDGWRTRAANPIPQEMSGCI